MEALLVLVGLLLLAYFFFAPAIALATASSASRRARDLELRVAIAEEALARLPVLSPPHTSAAAYRHPAVSPEPAPRPPLTPAATPAASWGAAPAWAPRAAPAPAETRSAPARSTGTPAEAPSDPRASGAAAVVAVTHGPALARHSVASDRETAASPTGAIPSPSVETPAEKLSLEEQLGLTWLTRIGAAAFVLGALFFFKYAVDSDWIGPGARVALGGAVGAGLIGAGELARRRTRPAFVQALVGIGLAVLFVTVWASSTLYGLCSVPAAFGVSTIVLLGGAALALRHRGEAILVLVLAAGLLDPVVLSSGSDRPEELFAYLLLVTTGVVAVAVRLRRVRVVWLAAAGTVALFTGWYARSFDAAASHGAMSLRAAPLLAALVFPAQWIAAAVMLRRANRPDAAAAGARALGVVALVAAHAGAAGLLAAAPLAASISALVLGAASLLALRRLEAIELTVVPMLAGFVAMLAAAAVTVAPALGIEDGTNSAGQSGSVLAIAAAWAATLGAGLLRLWPRPEGTDVGPALAEGVPWARVPAPAALQAALAVGLFEVVAGVLFALEHPAALAATLAAGALAIALLGARSGQRWVGAAHAGAAGLVLLGEAPAALAHEPAGAHGAAAFLAAAAAWALVHLVASALDAGDDGPAERWSAALAASIAGLTFAGAAILGTSADVPALRALLIGSVAVADLALGVTLAARRGDAGGAAAALLGQAIALLATAIAFAASGATVTVLWAMLAAVAAAAAARSGARGWLGVSAALLGAALVRLVFVDAAGVAAATDAFLASAGSEGVLRAPVLFNARAYALAGTGLALLAAARALSRAGDRDRGPAALGAILGYGLLLALAVSEVRAAVVSTPPMPPGPLDPAAWGAFRATYEASLAAQAGAAATATTLVLGLSAAALLGAGFLARDAFHRWLGLALFVITVAKLALVDAWRLERLHQIVLFTGTGALLVAGGFLYARFGQRIAALMRDRGPAH